MNAIISSTDAASAVVWITIYFYFILYYSYLKKKKKKKKKKKIATEDTCCSRLCVALYDSSREERNKKSNQISLLCYICLRLVELNLHAQGTHVDIRLHQYVLLSSRSGYYKTTGRRQMRNTEIPTQHHLFTPRIVGGPLMSILFESAILHVRISQRGRQAQQGKGKCWCKLS